MKRPGGFDRGPEREEIPASQPAGKRARKAARSALRDEQQASSVVQESQAGRQSPASADTAVAAEGLTAKFLRRRAREQHQDAAVAKGSAREAHPGSGAGSDAGSAPGSGSGSGSASGSGAVVAHLPTVDLTTALGDGDAAGAAAAGVGEAATGVIAEQQTTDLSGSVSRWREQSGVRAAKKNLRRAQREARRRDRSDSRRFRAAGRGPRRVWMIAGSAVAALALFVTVGVFTPVMAVRNIEVAGASRVDVQQVKNVLSAFQGEPIALVSSANVAKALEGFTLIESYAVEVRPPSTLYVQIVERTPVLVVRDGETYSQYDAAGVLLGSSPEPIAGLPLAEGQVRNVTTKSFLAAAKILRNMPADLRAQFVQVSADSAQSVEFAFSNGARVVWGDTENTKRKAYVLQTMMSSLAQRGFTKIDVSSPGAPVFQ